MSGAENNQAILLVAHGSVRYPEAARPAASQVARLLAADPGRPVAYGLLNGAPSVAEALAQLDSAEVRVVPFFMEDGYFTRVVVPRALGTDRRVRLCPPIGLHAHMADLIEAHVTLGCARVGLKPSAMALVIVGHGSARAPGRAFALLRHTAALSTQGCFGPVHAAHLEEAPFLPDVLARLRGWPVAVVGFFAGEGGHVRDDVPAALQAEQAARGITAPPVHNLGSVADNPGVVRIILDQVGTT